MIYVATQTHHRKAIHRAHQERARAFLNLTCWIWGRKEPSHSAPLICPPQGRDLTVPCR